MEAFMSDFQQNVEQIIKNHIEYLTSSRDQKKSNHMSHQYYTLLQELYDQETNGVIFVNHFGHIEYMNNSFFKFFMLDKYDKTFNNILNINQLPIKIDVRNHRFHMTYPNGSELSFNMAHQLVNFQKNTLLQFRFENTTEILAVRTELDNFKSRTDYFMEHVESPMFLIDTHGFIKDISSPYQTLFDIELSALKNHSIFESLPFDYANEVVERLAKVTDKVNSHFLYKHEANKRVIVLDTTLHAYKDQLILCHIKDVSDLNTMSSTIEYLNKYDSLTGFYNMAYYEQKLTELNNLGHMPLGIYVLTIQGLRRVNNKLGYHKCDNLIIELALDIQSSISQHEITCRISGDTFILFFPNTSEKNLNKFIATMEMHISKYKTQHADYHLTYYQKHLFLNEKIDDFIPLVKGLII